jgi:hypothetical protein
MGGVAAGGMLASGCGGDDNGGTPNMGEDGSADVTMQPPPNGDDGSMGGGDGNMTTTHTDGGDAGVSTDGGDAAPAPVHGKLILVHGSTEAPPLRFCYGVINGDAGAVTIIKSSGGIYPAPRTVLGVPPGTGGPAADSPVDLANRTIEIYALNALNSALASQPLDGGAEMTCEQLLGSDGVSPPGTDAGGLGLRLGVDYWDIGTLPAGTLLDGTTTLLVVNGCVPGITNTNDQVAECPSGYDPTKGDLGFWTAKLDTTTALDGGNIGAQFAYASHAYSFLANAEGNGVAAVAGFYVSTTFIPDAGAPADAGDAAVEAAAPVTVNVPHPIATGVTNGQLAPMSLVPVSGVTFDGTSGFFANVVAADSGATPFNAAVPLPNIQQVSAPSVPLDAGYFANGVGYVFVLVGDPGQPQLTDAGQFNVLSPHILGYPTNPPFPAN